MAEQETKAEQKQEDDQFKSLREDIDVIKKHLGIDKKPPTKDEILRQRRRAP